MNHKNVSRIFVWLQFALIGLLALWPSDNASWGDSAELMRGLGLALTSAGIAIDWTAVRQLGGSFTTSPIPKDGSTFVGSGLYKRIRHPIYTGVMLAGIGLTVDKGLFPRVFILAALIILFVFKASFEEAFLQSRYPEYKAYMAKTGMFLPRLNG